MEPRPDGTVSEHSGHVILLAMLPEHQRRRFDALWWKVQAQGTVEARFANAIAAWNPLLVSWSLRGKEHENTTLTPSRIRDRKRRLIG